MDYTIDEIISTKASMKKLQNPISVANIQIKVDVLTEQPHNFNFSITKRQLSTLIQGNLEIKLAMLKTWNELRRL